MQFDRSWTNAQTNVYYGFVAYCLCAKVNLDLHMGEDILELEPELSIILLTMIILPIFLNREENLLVKLDWGLPQYLFFIFDLRITVGKYNYKVIKQRIFFQIYQRHLMVLPLLKSQIYTVEV
jgi:hypothetical protein